MYIFVSLFVYINLFIVFKVPPAFGSSTPQPPRLQTVNPMNSSGGGAFSFGVGSTKTESSGSVFSSATSTWTNNPFGTGDETTSPRPVFKAKRRPVKH